MNVKPTYVSYGFDNNGNVRYKLHGDNDVTAGTVKCRVISHAEARRYGIDPDEDYNSMPFEQRQNVSSRVQELMRLKPGRVHTSRLISTVLENGRVQLSFAA